MVHTYFNSCTFSPYHLSSLGNSRNHLSSLSLRFTSFIQRWRLKNIIYYYTCEYRLSILTLFWILILSCFTDFLAVVWWWCLSGTQLPQCGTDTKSSCKNEIKKVFVISLQEIYPVAWQTLVAYFLFYSKASLYMSNLRITFLLSLPSTG